MIIIIQHLHSTSEFLCWRLWGLSGLWSSRGATPLYVAHLACWWILCTDFVYPPSQTCWGCVLESRTPTELSNAASHDSLRPTVREIAGGGGGGVIRPPGTQGCASSPGGDGLTRYGLIHHSLGYWRTHECLGGLITPPAISRTVGRRESCEAAFESSRRDAPESRKWT